MNPKIPNTDVNQKDEDKQRGTDEDVVSSQNEDPAEENIGEIDVDINSVKNAPKEGKAVEGDSDGSLSNREIAPSSEV